jgi:hypothetical protein
MPKNKSVKLRVIADRIDPSTGDVTDYNLHADNVQCRINADQRSGAAALQGSTELELKVSDDPADYQRVRVYGPDGVVRETLSAQNGQVFHAVGMTGDSILSGYQTKL